MRTTGSRWISAAALGLLLAAVPVGAQVLIDGPDFDAACEDAGGGAQDVQYGFQPGFTYIPGQGITMFQTFGLCALEADPETGYWLAIDSGKPFARDQSMSYDDSDSDGKCPWWTVDDFAVAKNGGYSGPGEVFISTEDLGLGPQGILQYAIPIEEIEPSPRQGEEFSTWFFTKQGWRRIADRLPNTDASDGCSVPQGPEEVFTAAVPCLASVAWGGGDYPSFEGTFSLPLDDLGGSVSGELVDAGLACDPFDPGLAAAVAGNIALIERGICPFSVKVQNAANAGAAAVVIYNSFDDQVIRMSGFEVGIPALFIGQSGGLALQQAIQDDPPVEVTLTAGCRPEEHGDSDSDSD